LATIAAPTNTSARAPRHLTPRSGDHLAVGPELDVSVEGITKVRKFAPGDGTVRVTLAARRRTPRSPSPDDGTGIEPPLPRVFARASRRCSHWVAPDADWRPPPPTVTRPTLAPIL